MLKQISCDIFGPKNKTIIFHDGLNIIEGVETNHEYNSIGKSTLLMIIDFVFAGTDYLKNITKFPENKQSHTLKFVFETNGIERYFTRSTNDSKNIYECDKDYNPLRSYTLKEYYALLRELNEINQYDLSFRDFVQRVTRVAGRETLDSKYPLQAVNKEPLKNGITSLLKIFNEYEALKSKKDEKAEIVKKEQNLTYNSKNGWMKIPSEKEYNSILIEEEDLKKQLDELVNTSNQGKENVKSLYAARLYEINNQILDYENELRRLNSLIRERAEYKSFSSSFKKDMKLVSHYFNQESVKTIQDVESFHIKLNATLSKEFESENEKIKNSVELINAQLTSLKDEAKKLEVPPSVPEHILRNSGAIQVRINEIDRLVENYRRKKQTAERKEKLSNELDEYYSSLFARLNAEINNSIIEFNNNLTKKTPSTFMITDEEHYTYTNHNDSSTGSGNRGLICFDLAMLKLTNLPYIIHDYDLIEPIETAVKEKLISLYNSIKGKQAFIVLKKEPIYTPETAAVIEEKRVITLSSDGNELFGEAWNKDK